MHDYRRVKSDFDRIADAGDGGGFDHNAFYYPRIISMIPTTTDVCLDIGCGTGTLTKLAAARCVKVIGVDLSERMIERAGVENAADNIAYVCGNITEMSFADNTFDAIISSATAHHLNFEWLLRFARDKLRPGGHLIILDIPRESSVVDYAVWGYATLPNRVRNKLIKKADNPEAEAAWKAHGDIDHYMTFTDIKRMARRHIPGATVKRLLYWRYLLHWEK